MNSLIFRSIEGCHQLRNYLLVLFQVEELGLDSDVVSVDKSHPATKNRFVYVNKKLHALPNSKFDLYKSGASSKMGCFYLTL